MSEQPEFSQIIAGTTEAVGSIHAHYKCGHCNSETELKYDRYDNPHLIVHHDDDCPVLNGAVSAIPDTVRAAGIDA